MTDIANNIAAKIFIFSTKGLVELMYDYLIDEPCVLYEESLGRSTSDTVHTDSCSFNLFHVY